MTDRLLTARELAERLRVRPETVLRWTRNGTLPAIRLPSGALRYREDDVEVWLVAQETQAADTGDRESPNAQARARRGGSLATRPAEVLSWETPNARLPNAARPEEDRHAT